MSSSRTAARLGQANHQLLPWRPFARRADLVVDQVGGAGFMPQPVRRTDSSGFVCLAAAVVELGASDAKFGQVWLPVTAIPDEAAQAPVARLVLCLGQPRSEEFVPQHTR
jgi:hypothetical protein